MYWNERIALNESFSKQARSWKIYAAMAVSTPSSSISDLVNERLLSTSPRCSSLQWNAKPQDVDLKALIETYSGPGICKSRGNVQTEWWLSYWIYYSRVKKHMSLIINNNTQIQGVHQGTPTENENFLKLQNVLALVQDNLQSRDFEQDFVGWKNLNEGQN